MVYVVIVALTYDVSSGYGGIIRSVSESSQRGRVSSFKYLCIGLTPANHQGYTVMHLQLNIKCRLPLCFKFYLLGCKSLNRIHSLVNKKRSSTVIEMVCLNDINVSLSQIALDLQCQQSMLLLFLLCNLH